MLVLTRTIGQRLVIKNGEIVLTVLEVRGNQVRLGIEAPKHIPIHREEIFQRIQREALEKVSGKVEEVKQGRVHRSRNNVMHMVGILLIKKLARSCVRR